MNIESTIKPKKFDIEYFDPYEKCLIRFNENIHKEQRQIEDATELIYIYDTYILKTWYRPTLEEDIKNNYNKWLNEAKQQEYNEYANIVRTKRDELLLATDYTQLVDSPLSSETVNKFKLYRQLLRDIPEQNGFPYEVHFPEKPKENEG